MKHDGGFTWHPYISKDSLFAVFDAADLRKVDIQSQKCNTAEEGHRAHKDTIITGILVPVEDAVLFHFLRAIDITLIGNAAKDHNGEELERKIQTKQGI